MQKNGEAKIIGLVSINELEYLLSTSRKELKDLEENFYKFYHPNYEKEAGKKRKIDRPKGLLKSVQKKLSKRVLSKQLLPINFHGYIKKKSYLTNANEHKGQRVIISIDVRSFFPSVSDIQVFDIFRKYLRYSTKISKILTRLTTYNNGLPQGAPTSGHLANLCMLPIYFDLNEISKKFNLRFTIYADDIVFSGNITRKQSTDLINEVILLLKKYGFSSKNKKIKMMPKHTRQIVTGLMVNNNKLSIPPKKLAECRKKLLDDKRSEKSKDGLRNFVKQVNKKQYKKLSSSFNPKN